MSDDGEPFRVGSIFADPSVSILGGDLEWLPLRRRLGIEAFGINAYRAASAGDVIIEDHVESPGQEEVYVVLRGRVRMTVDGRELDVGSGELVFVPDPGSRRSGRALEPDSAVLAVGGWRGEAYRPLPWEPIFLAQEAMGRGAWAEAAETLEREAGIHREHPFVRFRIACCRAQAGEHELALGELASALDSRPELSERIRDEPLLAPLHGLPGWTSLLS